MAETAIKRARILVKGRVQGVYYRASTHERALALRLSGWVRNTADGAVEIEAEGAADVVASLVAWCHEGPPAAVVREVQITELPVQGSSRFEIRR